MNEIKDMIFFLMQKGLIIKPHNIDILVEEYHRLLFDRIHGLSNIVQIVCYKTGVKESQLIEKTRKREIVQSRQISMYFMKKYTKLSLQSIGDYFYNPLIHHVYDHATVLHALTTVNNLIETDKFYKSMVDDIERNIKIKLDVKSEALQKN